MNQALYNFLGGLGFTGTLNERQKAYLLSVVSGAASTANLNDLWVAYGLQQGYGTTIQTIQLNWARANGSTGTTWNDALNGLPLSVPLAGTQLFLNDSQTGGAGGLHAPPYYLAQDAVVAGRLSSIWLRGVPATTATSGSGVAISGADIVSLQGAGSVGTLEQYCPNLTGIWVKPIVTALESITVSSNEFAMGSADGWFLQQALPVSFTAQFGSGTLTPVTIPAGVVGTPYKAFTLTNPSGNTTGSIVMTAFTGQAVFVGINAYTGVPKTAGTLQIVNFAIAGQTTAQWLSGVKNVPWMQALVCTGAIVTTGTNDQSGAVVANRASFRTNYAALFNELNTAGITDPNILAIRPNQNAMNLSGVWEEIWAARATMKKSSIIRLYGPLSTFNTNGWMSDTVHTNDIFNKIWGDAEWNANSLATAYTAVNNGINIRNYSQLATTTLATFNSDVVIAGDFTLTARFYWPASGQAFYICGHSTVFNDYFSINADGSVTTRVGDVPVSTSAGVAVPGFQVLQVVRVGAVVTTSLAGPSGVMTQISSATLSSSNMTLQRMFGNAGAVSKAGFMHSLQIANSTTPYLWNLDQTLDSETITATTGAINALWVNRTISDDFVSSYGYRGGSLINIYDGSRSLGSPTLSWFP